MLTDKEVEHFNTSNLDEVIESKEFNELMDSMEMSLEVPFDKKLELKEYERNSLSNLMDIEKL